MTKNFLAGAAMLTGVLAMCSAIGTGRLSKSISNAAYKSALETELEIRKANAKIEDEKFAKAMEKSQKIRSLASQFDPNNAKMVEAFKAYHCTNLSGTKLSDYKPITHEDSVAVANGLQLDYFCDDLERILDKSARDERIYDLEVYLGKRKDRLLEMLESISKRF